MNQPDRADKNKVGAGSEQQEEETQIYRLDLEGIDPEIVQEITAALDTLLRQYPETRQTLRTVAWAIPDNPFDEQRYIQATYFFAANPQGGLKVNKSKWGSPTDTRASKLEVGKYAVEGFFYPGCNTIKSLIDHEFGHLVYYHLLTITNVKLTIQGQEVSIADIVRAWSKRTYPDAELLSGYAKGKPGVEAFPEAFTSSLNTPKEEQNIHTLVQAQLLNNIFAILRGKLDANTAAANIEELLATYTIPIKINASGLRLGNSSQS
jgi:hypothetical protein